MYVKIGLQVWPCHYVVWDFGAPKVSHRALSTIWVTHVQMVCWSLWDHTRSLKDFCFIFVCQNWITGLTLSLCWVRLRGFKSKSPSAFHHLGHSCQNSLLVMSRPYKEFKRFSFHFCMSKLDYGFDPVTMLGETLRFQKYVTECFPPFGSVMSK